jgi:hypothetical protein
MQDFDLSTSSAPGVGERLDFWRAYSTITRHLVRAALRFFNGTITPSTIPINSRYSAESPARSSQPVPTHGC